MKMPIIIDDITQYGYTDMVSWQTLAEKLNRAIEYTNEDDFRVHLSGGSIHPTKNWIAWIDYYQKNNSAGGWVVCNYYLRIKVDDKQVFEWEVETYNPYFGAITLYMKWHDDRLVYIYLEKHAIYGVVFSLEDNVVNRIKLGANGSQLRIDEDILSLVQIESYDDGLIKQYHIPSWEQLPSITEDVARKKGLIE